MRLESGTFFCALNYLQDETWGPRIGPFGIAICYVLQHHANKEGWAWPSLETISNKTRVSVRKIRATLRRLEALGIVETRPGGGRRKTNWYRLRAKPPDTEPQTRQVLPGIQKETRQDVLQNPAVTTEKPAGSASELNTEPNQFNQTPSVGGDVAQPKCKVTAKALAEAFYSMLWGNALTPNIGPKDLLAAERLILAYGDTSLEMVPKAVDAIRISRERPGGFNVRYLGGALSFFASVAGTSRNGPNLDAQIQRRIASNRENENREAEQRRIWEIWLGLPEDERQRRKAECRNRMTAANIVPDRLIEATAAAQYARSVGLAESLARSSVGARREEGKLPTRAPAKRLIASMESEVESGLIAN